VDFTLRIVSNEKFDIPGLRVENVEWTLDGEPREIAKFDVGIMPLSDDPFSRGKSSYKLLQYMAAGVPALASAVGMNVEVAGEDENNALLAGTPDEFAAKLAGLLENAESRRTLALNGRRAVEQKYARPVIGERFAEIMRRLSKG
jgi:glycosyltransferase involved in cell wall biosynthesis